MREQTNQDSSKKNIKRNPSNPKYDSPKTNPLEVSENDQTDFEGADGDELNFDSEIEGDRSDKTEVDLDRTGVNQKSQNESGPAGPQ